MINLILILSLILIPFPIAPQAQQRTQIAPMFYPNFSQPVSILPKGTSITPICFNSYNCLNQWTQQAIPLSSSISSGFPKFNYFIPGFIPKRTSRSNPQNDRNWERVSLINERSSSTNRSFYINRNNTKKVKMVETDPETKKQKITEGQVVHIDINDIQVSAPDKGSSLPSKTPPKPAKPLQSGKKSSASDGDFSSSAGELSPSDEESSTPNSLKSDKSFSHPDKAAFTIEEPSSPNKKPATSARDSATSAGDSATSAGDSATSAGDSATSAGDSATSAGDSATSAGDSATSAGDSATSAGDSATSAGDSATSAGKLFPPKRESSSNDQKPPQTKVPPKKEQTQAKQDRSQVPNLVISRDTVVLPSHAVREIKTGCFVIDKQEIQTEAQFCLECIRDNEENSHFISLLKDQQFLDKMKGYLLRASNASKRKVNHQIAGSLSKDGKKKICSPKQTLSYIVKNFEKTCQPYKGTGGFKKFFAKSLCESCKKGIPIELMTAMMSIESGGNCGAHNSKGENSSGLFQIDSNQHKCTSKHKKGTEKNTKCLKNIHNNWNKSIEILTGFYKGTNGKSITKPCKNWLDMDSNERDAFRRAVAGYNGGYWILDNIRASRNNKKQDQSRFGTSKYKRDTANWEEIRAFYFTKNILQKSGRNLQNNLSNLAHTEAIFGREVKGSPAGIIEIWSQYKRTFLKENPRLKCRY